MMPSICFVEAMTYTVLNPESRSSPGGEAVQHTLLAREFARQGWDVSVVCSDVGQKDGEVIDGVKVFKTFRRQDGLPGVRFFYPRLYSLWRALKKADADVYFQSCAGLNTGIVAHFAKKHKRKMIFRVAHDTDCVRGQQLIKNSRDRWLYDYGLAHTHLISVQSDFQGKTLDDNYGLPSKIVNMVVQPPDDSSDTKKDIDVLWVNNLREFKRPDILCDIARQMPQVNFVMIGAPMAGFEAQYEATKAAADELPNLDYLGPVPYSEVNAYFERAKLFLNTSDSEGFPNSYLQAWIRGVPVISYFDPDGLIGSEQIGVAVPTQQDFCAPIERLLHADEERGDMGARARKFADDYYSAAAIVREYRELIAADLGIDSGQ